MSIFVRGKGPHLFVQPLPVHQIVGIHAGNQAAIDRGQQPVEGSRNANAFAVGLQHTNARVASRVLSKQRIGAIAAGVVEHPHAEMDARRLDELDASVTVVACAIEEAPYPAEVTDPLPVMRGFVAVVSVAIDPIDAVEADRLIAGLGRV